MAEEITQTAGEAALEAAENEAAESVYVASQWQLVWWRFRKHKLALISAGILIVLYIVVLFAEFFAPYDATASDKRFIYAPPQRVHFRDAEGNFSLRPFTYALTGELNMETLRVEYTYDTSVKFPVRFFVHGTPYKLWGLIETDVHLIGTDEGGTIFLLGTDKQGRDMLSRLIVGGRISLSVGLLGIAISFVLGILLGGLSGYYGGVFDVTLQRVIEFMRSVPTLPLWMGLSAALPPTWTVVQTYFAIVVILSLLGWTGLARVVRSKFMSLREEDFVMAARLLGASEMRIVFRHMVPSFTSHLIASLSLSIPGMILGETSLSFIGLGLRPPAISWGVLLKEAQAIRVLNEAPWLLYPGIAVVVAVLAFNFLGDGLRDAADPYSR
ncbi:MAG: ABC transporter permease [Anaerolineae bacterium]|jgi:peptide/nickel transport system permease protein